MTACPPPWCSAELANLPVSCAKVVAVTISIERSGAHAGVQVCHLGCAREEEPKSVGRQCGHDRSVHAGLRAQSGDYETGRALLASPPSSLSLSLSLDICDPEVEPRSCVPCR